MLDTQELPVKVGLKAHDSTAGFMIRLALALQRYGTPAHRLEDMTAHVARSMGLHCQVFALHTAVIFSFGEGDEQRVYIHRSPSGELNLEKQMLLYQVANDVIVGKKSTGEGEAIIDGIVSRKPWNRIIMGICSGLSAGAAARFFGGGWREMLVSAIGGILVGVLGTYFSRSTRAVKIFEPVASIMVSVLAALGVMLLGPMSTTIVILGGLVYLLPGFSVTVAMNEIASRHLISGTARLTGALMVLLIMGLGVMLGNKIVSFLHIPASAFLPIGLEKWTEYLALLIGLSSYVVLFNAPIREAPYVLLTGIITFAVSHGAAAVLGPDIATFLGALALGACGNLYARTFDRPATLPILPGLMYLVPGSIGLRGLFSMFDRSVLTAIEMLFQMSIIAALIVTGLLLANVIVPTKRAL